MPLSTVHQSDSDPSAQHPRSYPQPSSYRQQSYQPLSHVSKDSPHIPFPTPTPSLSFKHPQPPTRGKVNVPLVVSPTPCVTPVTASPSPLPPAATTLPVASVTPWTPFPTVFVAAPSVFPVLLACFLTLPSTAVLVGRKKGPEDR